MSDILEVLGRSCAEICSHQVLPGHKCTVCEVILYDDDRYITEATFADLLIASPRKQAPVSAERLQNQMHRLEEISERLNADPKSIVYQKEYIEANIAKSRAIRGRVVPFKSNTVRSRETLFPKSVSSSYEPVKPAIQSIDQSTGIINLARSDSPNRLRLRIVLPPYGTESSTIVVDVDESVSGRDLIDTIVSDDSSTLDSTRSYVLRWVEDEEELIPDMDLPPIDPDQPLTSINTNVLCLCDIEYDSDASDSSV